MSELSTAIDRFESEWGPAVGGSEQVALLIAAAINLAGVRIAAAIQAQTVELSKINATLNAPR